MKKSMKGWLGCLGVLFGVILLIFLGVYVYSEWIWEEWPPERIERISGIRIPKYKILNCYQGERHFTGDYEDRYEIEFVTMPSDELFEKIDKLIAAGNTKWVKEDNKYTFSIMWGNGLPTPKGEHDADDTTFRLTINKGKSYGEIWSGAW